MKNPVYREESEVQMLELDWVNQNIRDGVTPPIAYVHGELFGVGGVETIPDNPGGPGVSLLKIDAKEKVNGTAIRLYAWMVLLNFR